MSFLADENNYWQDVLALLISCGLVSVPNLNVISKVPCRTRPFSGNELVADILSGHPDRGYDHFRMTTTMFYKLEELLVSRGFVTRTRNVSIQEQLAIFLYGIGHGVTNRVLAETFQHSGETISRHFNNVLKAVCLLKHEFIVQPQRETGVHPRIRDNNHFHPYFKNAVGAIDGTHIPASIKKSKQARFRNRKGTISQNVMAAVSFDHSFLFVCTGWEGSAADMRVLRWCVETGGLFVPEGKFYLVDSGYGNSDRFLAPFRGNRYHLSTFNSRRSRRYKNSRDLYNHRHAQLRNCVEKAFGILKKRFKILRTSIGFPFKVQKRIVMACCIIHNFIRRTQGNDKYFNMSIESLPDDNDDDVDPYLIIREEESLRGDQLRDSIAERLWLAHNNRSKRRNSTMDCRRQSLDFYNCFN